MNAVRFFDYLARVAGTAALALGIALYTGRLNEQLGVHVGLGIIVALALLVLSALALSRRARPALGISGIAWSGVTVALGLSQTQLLPGHFHWIVQVVHLAVGLTAIALAVALSRVLQANPTQSSTPS